MDKQQYLCGIDISDENRNLELKTILDENNITYNTITGTQHIWYAIYCYSTDVIKLTNKGFSLQLDEDTLGY